MHDALASSGNIEGTRRLSEFLLSDRAQKFLASFDGGLGDGIPIFHPIKNTGT